MAEVIPGYLEAIAREQLVRNAAFVPASESICGIEVLPMTPEHHAILALAGSPFLYRGIGKDEILSLPSDDVARCVREFLWVISPGYHPRAHWRRWRLYRRVGRLNHVRAIDEILDYVKEVFLDSPASPNNAPQKSYYSCFAGLVHVFGKIYGWPEPTTMRTPYKKLFQLLNQIAAEVGIPMANASDAIRAAYRAGKNAAALAKLESMKSTTSTASTRT